MIDIIGMNSVESIWAIPLYRQSFVNGVGRIPTGHHCLSRIFIILRYMGCGNWMLAAFKGRPFQWAVSPLNWKKTRPAEPGQEG
jgi:hypothetical protein